MVAGRGEGLRYHTTINSAFSRNCSSLTGDPQISSFRTVKSDIVLFG